MIFSTYLILNFITQKLGFSKTKIVTVVEIILGLCYYHIVYQEIMIAVSITDSSIYFETIHLLRQNYEVIYHCLHLHMVFHLPYPLHKLAIRSLLFEFMVQDHQNKKGSSIDYLDSKG